MEKDFELKSLYVDLERRVFEVNGKPLPKDCDELHLSFESGEWILTYNVKVTLGKP